jgi:predicted nucleotidyltransferase
MLGIADLPQNLIPEIKQELSAIYGDRLNSIYLYGSYARGEASQDSDVDFLVVLNNTEQMSEERSLLRPISHKLYFKYDLDVSLHLALIGNFHKSFPLYFNVRNEGVMLN